MTEIVKAAGRTLAEFQPLKAAEQKLLEACRQGEFAKIAEECPEAANDSNTVRAVFLRFLALGGDERNPLHEHGVALMGAWVEGVLDLAGTHIPRSLVLNRCRFSGVPLLYDSRIHGTLSLVGSHVNGLKADRMICDGGVFLRNGFTANGTVRLLGTQIGGDLDCSGANLDGKEGRALSCEGAGIKGSVLLTDSVAVDGKKTGFTANGEVCLLGAQIGGELNCSGARFVKIEGKEKESYALSFDRAAIKGSVFLSNGFTANGTVRLLGAKIGGDLTCSRANFDGRKNNALLCDGAGVARNVFLRDGFTANGEVRLQGAQIGGDLDCSGAKLDNKNGDALRCEGACVAGRFFFRKLVSPVNGVSLASMQVRALLDDEKAWGERLILDGFVYGELSVGAPTDADTRRAWLDKQLPSHAGLNEDGANFKPQPWQQLIRVLRHMGHAEGARQVAIAFEDRLRRANLIGQATQHWYRPDSWIYRHICRIFHCWYGRLIGYGYRPLRMLGWMFGVWLACGMFYWYAALDGVFAPSNAPVFQNPKYEACTEEKAGNWYLCEKLPEEYTGFSPLAYSLDVILPLVDLQQETDWAPLIATPKSVWYEEWLAFDLKHFTRLVVWFEILFGWVASLLLVAVVSGLTKRREE